MKIGFTGTRSGLNEDQILSMDICLRGLNSKKVIDFAHHGCCVGADSQFHWLIRKIFDLRVCIIGHRSTTVSQQNSLVVQKCDQIRDPLPPLLRNKNIVNEVDLLIAGPGSAREEQRSGTWATIRYARRVKKPVILIYPSGMYQLDD